jgi:hypothetical protein
MFRILLTLILISTSAFAEWDSNIPLSVDDLQDFPVDNQENLDRLELVLREYPKGISLSYSSASTIVASTGGVVCADSAGTTKKFRGNTSTTNITFSDLDTGSESAGTYYVYANCDATATTATFKISSSSTSPSGVTYYKRIGSFVNDGSNNITASSITNDIFPNLISKQNSTVYLNNNTNLGGYTISNGYLGKTTTGSTAEFTFGSTITVPTGCYVIGGYKQSDGNFTIWNYACP